MLMSTLLTASLLTSGDGVVRLCVAVPTVDLLPYFGGSQNTPQEAPAVPQGGWEGSANPISTCQTPR